MIPFNAFQGTKCEKYDILDKYIFTAPIRFKLDSEVRLWLSLSYLIPHISVTCSDCSRIQLGTKRLHQGLTCETHML